MRQRTRAHIQALPPWIPDPSTAHGRLTAVYTDIHLWYAAAVDAHAGSVEPFAAGVTGRSALVWSFDGCRSELRAYHCIITALGSALAELQTHLVLPWLVNDPRSVDGVARSGSVMVVGEALKAEN
jgi:hypothetical protein